MLRINALRTIRPAKATAIPLTTKTPIRTARGICLLPTAAISKLRVQGINQSLSAVCRRGTHYTATHALQYRARDGVEVVWRYAPRARSNECFVCAAGGPSCKTTAGAREKPTNCSGYAASAGAARSEAEDTTRKRAACNRT